MSLSIILPSQKRPKNSLIETLEYLYPNAKIIVSMDAESKGKGWAIRQALSEADTQYIAFLDSDGDIEPRMLNRLLPFLEDFDCVVGSKRINHKYLFRRMITFLSRIYIRLMFNLKVDTQTGIKVFNKRVLREWKTDGFFFDVEVLNNVQKRGGSIIEVPIEAEINEILTKGAICRTLKESVILKYQLLFHAKH